MKLLVLDGNSLVNRAYFGIKLLTTKDGRYTNAIFGFQNILLNLLSAHHPDAVAIAWDEKAPTFRHTAYDGYKATRHGMPQELAEQMPVLKQLLTDLGFVQVSKAGWEADDILGTLAAACEAAGGTTLLATGDRDSLQLVDDATTVLLATNKETIPMDPAAIREKYGIEPPQLIDVKSLMGDASDNIPGVPGIGEKTALALISKFGSLQGVYDNIDDKAVKPGQRAKLTANRDKADLSYMLGTIRKDAPIETDPAAYIRQPGDPAAAAQLLATLEMPDSGHIRLNGADVVDHPELARSRIGWMPDYFHPYKNTSVREYLDFFARACGMGRERLLDAVDEVMDFTELAGLQNQMIDKLSKGQTQRLCLARTLISDAQFLILDEPAAGLDPKARLEFKNLVHLLKARGKTLLISSHILSELGEMCDALIFMNAGTVIHDGNMEDLLHRQTESGYAFEIRTAGDDTASLEEWLALRRGWKVRHVQQQKVVAAFVSCEPEAVAAELRQLCLDLPVIDFHRSERRLEEAFVDILIHGSGEPAPRQNPASSQETPSIPAS